MPQQDDTAGKLLHSAGHMRQKACRHGVMLYNINDVTIGKALDVYGEFSELEAAFMCGFVAPGDVVVDVGANIGALTLPLANAVGAEGSLIAFEPQPALFQILCANIALNGLRHVRTVNAAVGADGGSVKLPKLDVTQPGLFGAHGIGTDVAGDTGGVVKLDDALRLNRCTLMKIDVEGMEAEVIRGARDLITRCQPVLYVENDRKANSPALIRLLQELGYTLYWHLPPLFNPDNFFRESRNAFERLISINMLCAPDGVEVPSVNLHPIHGPEDWWEDLAVDRSGTRTGRRNVLDWDPLRG